MRRTTIYPVYTVGMTLLIVRASKRFSSLIVICLSETQEGRICADLQEGNRLRWLRMANEIQCTIPRVTQLQCSTVKHSGCTNATTGHQIV